MVATGTGIAPFRSFWRRCFFEDVPGYKFNGLFWLFMGVANSDAKLYDDELSAIAAKHPENFRLDYALSREQNNRKGGKMYIQDKIEEYADEVFDLLNNNKGHMYFCGLKGMMPGINEMLERVCKEKKINYEEFVETLKHENRWHVEVRSLRAVPTAWIFALVDSHSHSITIIDSRLDSWTQYRDISVFFHACSQVY